MKLDFLDRFWRGKKSDKIPNFMKIREGGEADMTDLIIVQNNGIRLFKLDVS
jgi:hypothetical protein